MIFLSVGKFFLGTSLCLQFYVDEVPTLIAAETRALSTLGEVTKVHPISILSIDLGCQSYACLALSSLSRYLWVWLEKGKNVLTLSSLQGTRTQGTFLVPYLPSDVTSGSVWPLPFPRSRVLLGA